MKQRLPFSLTLFHGAIGKEFVIKHYRYGKIRTKFPDMSRIIATLAQRKCRDLFKKAVAYAKEVIADEQRKRDWQKRIRRRNGVYNEAVKYFMLKDKRAKEASMAEIRRLIQRAFAEGSKKKTYAETDQVIVKLLPARRADYYDLTKCFYCFFFLFMHILPGIYSHNLFAD